MRPWRFATDNLLQLLLTGQILMASMRPWRFATDNPEQAAEDYAREVASMRPWRFATDNRKPPAFHKNGERRFNEAVAFCHG